MRSAFGRFDVKLAQRAEELNPGEGVTLALTDGRRFRIHHQPMPDGGWVATHEDLSAGTAPAAEDATTPA